MPSRPSWATSRPTSSACACKGVLTGRCGRHQRGSTIIEQRVHTPFPGETMKYWKILCAAALACELVALLRASAAADPRGAEVLARGARKRRPGPRRQLLRREGRAVDGGSLKIEVFPSAQLIPTKDEVRAATRGQVDIIAPQTSYFIPIDNSWDVFYMPMLFDNAQQGMRIVQGDATARCWPASSATACTGWASGMTARATCSCAASRWKKPADLAGKKIRIFPRRRWKPAYARPTASWSRCPRPTSMSLQQGLIEGVVSAITFAAPSRWYEVVRAGPA